jgi:hypothetical protein
MGGLSVNFKGHRQRHRWMAFFKVTCWYLLRGTEEIPTAVNHTQAQHFYNQTCKRMWTDVSATQQYHLNRPGKSNSVTKRQYRIWCSHSGLPDIWTLGGCNTASSGSRSQCLKNLECLHLQDQTDQASWAAWPRWRYCNPFKHRALLACWRSVAT